jgi:hypothetical protein
MKRVSAFSALEMALRLSLSGEPSAHLGLDAPLSRLQENPK